MRLTAVKQGRLDGRGAVRPEPERHLHCPERRRLLLPLAVVRQVDELVVRQEHRALISSQNASTG
jgi:hypothetical protein